MGKKINWYSGKTANSPADMQKLCDQVAGATEPQNLAEVIKGSETVVVDVAEDGQSLDVHLDAGVANKIENSLQLPQTAPSSAQLVGVGTNKAQTMVTVGSGLYLGSSSSLSITLYDHTLRIRAKAVDATDETTYEFFMHIITMSNIIKSLTSVPFGEVPCVSVEGYPVVLGIKTARGVPSIYVLEDGVVRSVSVNITDFSDSWDSISR